MKVLILGASGATGILVVRQILKQNILARIVVRDINKIPGDIRYNNMLEIVEGSITTFGDAENIKLVCDCDAVVCCLGHNITVKGIYGKPRMLVTESVRNICEALNTSNKSKIKLILMNTTGNRNRKIRENYSIMDRGVIFLLRFLLPPQKDNEDAAAYLADNFNESNSKIEWVAVRPDGLVNEETESEYEVFESPVRSPVFNAGKTSRINVSHFMKELLTNEKLWKKWKYKMPVVYNKIND